ncbi:hypothetical protein CLV62_12167 [Dysgonomonas alginatilytica]|uniref:NlpE-like protein n=1 Tax=Dysgonomonas alginatilytica TaxID=1605892 RepID=A0A2V3PL43_9BACT|nr:hypothetical protein [Dysgonomonas alginatilytica]PXV62244.1 hypothetical protein CLV62_12167 [Dysgonomonas alginatilytica]
MKYKIVILLCIMQAISLGASAQSHLNIKDVFDLYGKQGGSVLVQLSTDVLSQGSKITFYKSLITDESVEKNRLIWEAMEADIKNGTKISELKKDGKIESGTYYLKTNSSSKTNEYILYKNKSRKITLVYLQGDFPPQQLEYELKKLKDLFIYVNNKRLKLQ